MLKIFNWHFTYFPLEYLREQEKINSLKPAYPGILLQNRVSVKIGSLFLAADKNFFSQVGKIFCIY